MRRRRSPGRPRKTARRWHIPPPLVHGPEPLEGGAVLEEVPGPKGVVLWQALRDVLLWVEVPTEERESLFSADAARRRAAALRRVRAEQALAAPLQLLTSLVEQPARVTEEAIAGACRQIADWAEGNGASATALAFAQDAALADARDPQAALAVARLAVRQTDHARAEVWFRRAIGLARQARDWRMYARAFSGLGSLYLSRGNLPAASRFHLRALRGARRGGLRGEQATALHDLFGLAIEMGRAGEAQRLAREAFEAYGARNPRVSVLAHDVAYFWMQQGHFARALAVFQAVLPLIDHPVERLWVEADLMRAAAGAGEDGLARQTAEVVRQKCQRPEFAAGAARALLETARGALQLQDWDAAQEAAEGALRFATERREGKTRLMAESLLDAIRSSRAAGRPPGLPEPSRAAASADTAAESLAHDFIRTLRALTATGTHA